MLLGLIVSGIVALASGSKGDVDVSSFGAKGDGVFDNTGSFQRAMDVAGKLHVNVSVGSGNFRFLGRLSVPEGVALRGTWESVPAHNGIRDKGLPKPTDGGTTFLVEAGEGSEADPFLTLNTNTTLKRMKPILRLFAARTCFSDDLNSCFTHLLCTRRSFKSVMWRWRRNSPLQTFSSIPWLHRCFFTLTTVCRKHNEEQEIDLR